MPPQGAALVFVLDIEDRARSQRILDGMLGFAGGVMLAASYWSLLAPAIEIAEQSELYGPDGRWAFVPAAVGFALGAAALFGTEKVLAALESLADKPRDPRKKDDDYDEAKGGDAQAHSVATPSVANTKRYEARSSGRRRGSLSHRCGFHTSTASAACCCW